MPKLTVQTANIQKLMNAPSLTFAERDLLVPRAGSVIYNKDDEVLEVYSGEKWLLLLGTRTGGGGGASGSGLYSFTTATFTPGGQTGRSGPSLNQAISGLSGPEIQTWSNNIQYFNVSNGVQLWTVPKTGTYSIDCFGAQGATGGNASNGTGGAAGGLGARIKGDFSLKQGDLLSIVVGQQGITQTNGWGGGGGGGGTFVWKSDSTTLPLIAAGGGGCGGQSSIGQQDASITTSGRSGSNSGGAGGTGGFASQSQGICGGGGGRGWLGGQSYHCGGNFTYAATYIDASGHDSVGSGFGGFGGGGASWGGGGGGGGYSGGGAAGWSYSGFGGGGGSYNGGTNQTNTEGARSGPGQVIITFIS